MADTPSEEPFVEGLMEPESLSPSFFIDLPPTPDPDADHTNTEAGQLAPNDLALSYISHMLMEDDMDSAHLLCEYSDHPALHQVEQPFVQILSSTWPLSSSSDHQDTISKGSTAERGDDFLRGRGCTINKDADVNAVKSYLKLKGMNRFLLRENVEAMMVVDESEEIGTHEIFDEMMLHGYETCILDMDKLRIAMANEEAGRKDTNNKKGRRKARRRKGRDVVDLLTLLMRCAQAVDESNYTSARELLKEIEQHASATGDATQRLAQCFAKGLEVRLAGTGSKLCGTLMAERPSVIEFLRAYKLYMAACCFHRVAIVFNVMTILRATVGKSKLHIVDYGFQWAGLLRWLSNRRGGPPEVRITAIPHHLGQQQQQHHHHHQHQAEQIEDAGRQLSDCARVFRLPSFKFHVIMAKPWEAVRVNDLNKDADEVLVVNDLFNFTILPEESVYFDVPSPRDRVLKNIRNMRPDVFIQGVINCSHGASFLSRFRETLYYYSAMFDMLDATMPMSSKQRLVLERHVLGPCALNVIACEGTDRVHRSDTYRQWQMRNRRAGLRQLPLQRETMDMVRDEVSRHYRHKDFVIDEDHQWLLQGWKGRILYAHSTWVADES